MNITYNNVEYDENEIAEQVKAFMQANGIKPEGTLEIVIDGNIHRFKTEGDKHGETSGAYKIYDNGYRPAGLIQDFRHGQPIKWKYDTSQLTDEQKKQLREQTYTPEQQALEQKRKAEELKRQKEKQALAVERAYSEFINALYGEPNKHPYCKLKNVRDYTLSLRIKTERDHKNGDVAHVGALLIPLHNAETRHFQALQLISGNLNQDKKYMKMFYTGTSAKGACLELIPFECGGIEDFYRADITSRNEPPITAQKIFICEGSATGLTIYEELNIKNHGRYPVLCAMSCHNIINVAKAYRYKAPNAEIIIMADNDEAGIKCAQETIKAGFANTFLYPPTEKNDWNDYYNKKGNN